MTGTKLPALFSSAKNSRPLLPASAPAAPPAATPDGVDALGRLVRGARITGKRDGVLEIAAKQVRPVGRRCLDDVLVHDEGHDAVVVAVPGAVGILGAVRDRVPGGDLVWLDQAFLLGERSVGETDVDHVGRLRAGVALVGADRLHLVGGAGVGVELVDRDSRILRLETVDYGAVAAPVMRQRDRGQRAFLLGGGHKVVHRRRKGCACHGADSQRRYCSHECLGHRVSPSTVGVLPCRAPFRHPNSQRRC